MPGKQISVTLSPYIFTELESISKKRGLTKSAIISIAIEKYTRQEKITEREEQSRDKK